MSLNDVPFKINLGKGIMNLGNTCYLNTVIQMLSVLPEFHPSQSKSLFYKKRHQHPIFIQWNEIMENLLSESSSTAVIHPGMFIQTLFQNAKTNSFQINQNEPQDAAEFLQFLIEEFHQILAHPVKVNVQGNSANAKDDMAKICYEMLGNIYQTNYSEIYPLCYGVTVSTLTPISSLTNPKPISMRPEIFFLLPIPLPPCPPFQINAPVTLYQCLDQMILSEIMENENAWFDEKLGYKRPVNKQTVFWNFPPILTISLQRLLPTGDKDNRVVQFPLKYFNLSPYVQCYNKDQFVYELVAVGLHHGNLGGGHYTAMVRRTETQWVHYNDHMVQPLPIFHPTTSDADNQRELEKILHHPDVYCLLYRKMII